MSAVAAAAIRRGTPDQGAAFRSGHLLAIRLAGKSSRLQLIRSRSADQEAVRKAGSSPSVRRLRRARCPGPARR